MLSNGIPTTKEYMQLSSQAAYNELLQYSRQFQTRCQASGVFSKIYKLKWVEDPFLQWSRSWEYVYALQRLERWWTERPGVADIMDAGSGFTFFPFYLQQLRPVSKIQCLDSDATVGKAIGEAGKILGSAPSFNSDNLENLQREANSIDAVYSISVIEHTQNPQHVLNEIHRILKPGGLFICTFDISFEKQSPMHFQHVENLIAHLTALFDPEFGWGDVSVREKQFDPDIVTTRWIADHAPDKLPWKSPILVWLYDAFRGRVRSTLYRSMTFYCGAFYKR